MIGALARTTCALLARTVLLRAGGCGRGGEEQHRPEAAEEGDRTEPPQRP